MDISCGNRELIRISVDFVVFLTTLQEYFSLSMEDAVHQPMTAHLEATAVAGISTGDADLQAAAPAEPTILTSPYGVMGECTHDCTLCGPGGIKLKL